MTSEQQRQSQGKARGAAKIFLLMLWVSLYEIFSVIFFTLCPNVRFHWARGANARGRTKRRGKSSQGSGLPSPLGSPPRAPSFLILSSLRAEYCVRHAESAKLSVHSSCGSSERHTSNSNARQAAYAKRETHAPRGKGNEEMGARGKNLKGKGGMRASEFPPFLFGLFPRTRAPRPIKINLWSMDKAYYAEYLNKKHIKPNLPQSTISKVKSEK